MTILEEVFRRAGNQKQLAEKLGISRSAVCQWHQVPLQHVRTIARITGIALKQLRPDVYGSGK